MGSTMQSQAPYVRPRWLRQLLLPSQPSECVKLREAAQLPPPPMLGQTKDTNNFRNLSIAERRVSVDVYMAQFFYTNVIQCDLNV